MIVPTLGPDQRQALWSWRANSMTRSGSAPWPPPMRSAPWDAPVTLKGGETGTTALESSCTGPYKRVTGAR
jgi:hypothetical protein